MGYLVSPCCGAEYSDFQDEEGNDVYKCNSKNCNESFDEPLDEYEYNEQMREAKAEMEADERRDMSRGLPWG